MNEDMEFFNRFSHMYLHGFKNLSDMFAEPATEHGLLWMNFTFYMILLKQKVRSV